MHTITTWNQSQIRILNADKKELRGIEKLSNAIA
jgi:hypothetical protein